MQPFSYWRLGATDGLRDLGPHGYHLTPSGLLQPSTPILENDPEPSLLLSGGGSGGSYSSFPWGSGSLGGKPSVTMTCWFYMPPTSIHGILIYFGDSSFGNGVAIGSGDGDTNGTTVLILYQSFAWQSTGITVGVGRHQLVYIQESDSYSTIWLDGVLRYNRGSRSGFGTNNGFAVGERGWSDKIKDVATFDRILTGNEIRELWAARTAAPIVVRRSLPQNLAAQVTYAYSGN